MSSITLDYGNGGIKSQELISGIILESLQNEILSELDDGGRFGEWAISTDSFVISPLFFKGGDIGKVAVCGTINDLLMCGSIPEYLTLALIIEEGFEMEDLRKIIQSVKRNIQECNVKVITGDTKVVEKGKGDGIYINTSGVGKIYKGLELGRNKIKSDDIVIVTGPIGTHGISILGERYDIELGNLESDCKSLLNPIKKIFEYGTDLKFLRDATRGGLATILNEIVDNSDYSIELYKEELPIEKEVIGISELLGVDPLYSANEGMAVIIANEKVGDSIIQDLKEFSESKDARIIGKVVDYEGGRVFLKNEYGYTKILRSSDNNLLPRIC